MVPTTTARDEKIATVRADVGTTGAAPPQAPPGHPVGATATVEPGRNVTVRAGRAVTISL